MSVVRRFVIVHPGKSPRSCDLTPAVLIPDPPLGPVESRFSFAGGGAAEIGASYQPRMASPTCALYTVNTLTTRGLLFSTVRSESRKHCSQHGRTVPAEHSCIGTHLLKVT